MNEVGVRCVLRVLLGEIFHLEKREKHHSTRHIISFSLLYVSKEKRLDLKSVLVTEGF